MGDYSKELFPPHETPITHTLNKWQAKNNLVTIESPLIVLVQSHILNIFCDIALNKMYYISTFNHTAKSGNVAHQTVK